jgi:hypothetical protein
MPGTCSSENHRPGACMPSTAKTLAEFVTEITQERSASLPTEVITVSETLAKWLNSRKAQLSLRPMCHY